MKKVRHNLVLATLKTSRGNNPIMTYDEYFVSDWTDGKPLPTKSRFIKPVEIHSLVLFVRTKILSSGQRRFDFICCSTGQMLSKFTFLPWDHLFARV